MEDCWHASYQIIKKNFDEVHRRVEQAIQHEEEEKFELALNDYKFGIGLIDEALSTPIAIPEEVIGIDESIKEACKMIQKMKKERADMVQHVNYLLVNHPNNMKQNEMIEKQDSYFMCDDVKFYYINPIGECTTTAESSILRIVCLNTEQNDENPTYFLQIIFEPSPNVTESNNDGEDAAKVAEFQLPNSWIYPLIPGVSKCFVTNYRAFIFPDIQSSVHGSAFGVMVPSESFNELLQILETLLLAGLFKDISDEAEEGDEDLHLRTRRMTSKDVSENIVKGSQYISQNVIKASRKAGELVTRSTPYVLSKVGKAHENTQPMSQGVLTGVGILKTVTGVAADLTSYAAKNVGIATTAIGQYLAPHVQTQGSKFLSKALGYETNDANEKMKDVLTITAGAVTGLSTVYLSLEESAGILGRSISDNSVNIIQHKYGASAGTAAAGTFDAFGNVISVSRNISYFTPKGLIQKSAKNTGRALIGEYSATKSGEWSKMPTLSEMESNK